MRNWAGLCKARNANSTRAVHRRALLVRMAFPSVACGGTRRTSAHLAGAPSASGSLAKPPWATADGRRERADFCRWPYILSVGCVPTPARLCRVTVTVLLAFIFDLPVSVAMLTAQARLTRARGLHATRSRRWSDNDTSSLPEQNRDIACRFLFFRWHRAHTCHAQALNVRTATSTDRWPGPPGSQAAARISCAPCPWHMCASGKPGGRWARLLPVTVAVTVAHAGWAGDCALCVGFLCT